MIFEKMNNFSLSPKIVRMVIVGLIIMVSGYILMIGGGSDDPNVFNEEMFDFQRLVASPILVILGIVIIITSIMSKPKDGGDKE